MKNNYNSDTKMKRINYLVQCSPYGHMGNENSQILVKRVAYSTLKDEKVVCQCARTRRERIRLM